MQPGGLSVVNLHAINAEVVFLSERIFGVDQRQRDEGPAVFLPRREHGQFIQASRPIDDFRYRPARNSSRAEFEKVAHQRTMFPKLRAIGRQKSFGDAY